MSMSGNSLVLVTVSSERRSVSPMTPSPSREMRGIRLFRAISRKLTRRKSQDDLQNNQFEEDSRSSSTDSCSSTSAGRRCSRSNNGNHQKKLDCSSAESGFRSVSPHHMSSSSSDAGSDSSKSQQRHHHSTSAESIRRVFLNLSISARSKSCNGANGKETGGNAKRKNKKSSAVTPPKRILRSPVSYTYVKGLSGLPTQRVPKTMSRVYMNNPCGCSMQYMAALNR